MQPTESSVLVASSSDLAQGPVLASGVRRHGRLIAAWAGTLVRLIASGVLQADQRRALRRLDDAALNQMGVTRPDLDTVELIHRAFARRHG